MARLASTKSRLFGKGEISFPQVLSVHSKKLNRNVCVASSLVYNNGKARGQGPCQLLQTSLYAIFNSLTY